MINFELALILAILISNKQYQSLHYYQIYSFQNKRLLKFIHFLHIFSEL
jgi:hypothetical protein